MPSQPSRRAAIDLTRAVLFGAGLGSALIVFGVAWTAVGDGAPVDLRQLADQGIFGTLAGAVIGLVLYLTKAFRARGPVQYYCSWVLATVTAAFILFIPGIPEDGWKWVIQMSLLLGVGAGLGLGIAAQQVSQDRWHK